MIYVRTSPDDRIPLKNKGVITLGPKNFFVFKKKICPKNFRVKKSKNFVCIKKICQK